MLKSLRHERGSALVTALLLMGIMLTLGIATLGLVETGQHDSRRERARESSFGLAEGVLNAQIYQLSTRWPASDDAVPYPAVCSASSTDADCPGGTTLQSNFTGVDYRRLNDWQVQVRDNSDGSSSTKDFYSDSLLNTADTRDVNGDNFLWVRATAKVDGRRRTLVALVEAENVTLNFPRATLVAGHFETSNNGNKVLIDSNGEHNEFSPGDIIVRCSLSSPGCADWQQSKGQLDPDTTKSNPSQPPAVSPEALDALRARAKAQSNYYAGCAPSLEGRGGPGEIVFMENATGCQYNANATYNTVAEPGYVVIGKGAPVFNGNATFYGIIYHANTDNQTGNVITLTGNITVYGSIVIDGPGGLSAGSSKANLVYDPNVFGGFKAFGTAGIVQNTFREITAPN
jgi:hypothetical protein